MAVVVLYWRQFVLTVPALLLNTVSYDCERPAMAYPDFTHPLLQAPQLVLSSEFLGTMTYKCFFKVTTRYHYMTREATEGKWSTMLSQVHLSIGGSEDAHFYKFKSTGTQLKSTRPSEHDMRSQQAESTGNAGRNRLWMLRSQHSAWLLLCRCSATSRILRNVKKEVLTMFRRWQ